MRTILRPTVMVMTWMLSASAVAFNKEIPFDHDQWILHDGARIVQHEDRLALNGTAYLKDVELLNGTLEVDLWTTGQRNFAGFMFRVQSPADYEWCWMRLHKTNGEIQDGIQYAPIYHGASCWQLNGGSGGIAPVDIPKNQWVHLKLVMLNETAQLYVGNRPNPALVMDRLQLGLKPGSVGLRINLPDTAYFSNFSYTLNDQVTKQPAAPAMDDNIVSHWQLSPAYKINDFSELSTYPSDKLAGIQDWTTPDVQPTGLVNITEVHGRTGGAPDCAILRTQLVSDRKQRIQMNFGYSDAVAIFLNQQPLFWGDSAYRSRNMAYGGWISFNDAVYLDLKKGTNELVVVTAEDFGGWGFQAQLESFQGIAFQRTE